VLAVRDNVVCVGKEVASEDSEPVLTDPVAHPRHQVKIGVKHASHQISVAGKDKDEVFVLRHVDELHKHLNDFGSIISRVLLVETIGLVNEEDASERSRDHLSGLGSGVPDVLAYEIRTGGLDSVASVDEAHFLVELSHLHCHSGLACGIRVR
jgi:hypothetical protein